MKTLGIDLASDPKKTGVCVIVWGESGAVVDELRVGANDAELLAAHGRVDATGIDAPFGWPLPFLRMTQSGERILAQPWGTEHRDRLRFRTTDFRVRDLTGLWPLSVSSDLIAVPAMRCVGLLHRMGVTDKAGDGRVFEIYPAAGLAAWGLPARGYKGAAKRARREALVSALECAAPWLRAGSRRELMVDRDDAFDAVVAAIIARAAAIGQTVQAVGPDREAARTEGWIHVPFEGSLQSLA